MRLRDYYKRMRSIAQHPNNRGRLAVAFARALYGYFVGYATRRPAVHNLFSSGHIKLYPGSGYWRNILYYGDRCEWSLANFLRNVLRPGDSFLDIGANIGYTTIIAYTRVGSDGFIRAAEPNPINFQRLSENVQLNSMSHVDLRPVAVGCGPGPLHLTLDDIYSRVVRDSTMQTVEVSVDQLDDLADRSFTVCKVDVEGLELDVFKSGKRVILAGHLPVIIFEHNGSNHRYGINDHEVFDYLRSLGYQLGVYDPLQKSINWSAELWDDVIAASPAGVEFLAGRLAK